jgi:hypothetical protein
MSAEKIDPLFYAFGTSDLPECPECGNAISVTRRTPSSILGDNFERQTFACKCGFEIERHTGTAARTAAQAAH